MGEAVGYVARTTRSACSTTYAPTFPQWCGAFISYNT